MMQPRVLKLALRAAAAILVLGAALHAATAAASKPNILVILTDDQGHVEFSGAGTRDLRTPAIDRIAREGIRFSNFRANCCVCSPTRAALITGRNPDRAGVPGVIRTDPAISWGYLAQGVPTLPDVLKPAGYHTALIGKWHLGLEAPNLPNQRGFDLFRGFLGDMMNDYWNHLRGGRNFMRRNGETIDSKGPHATDLFTDWACAYLEERAKAAQPFFLLLAYNAPHDPIQPPPEWLAKVKAREPGLPEARARLVALIEHLDAGVGRVLDTLDRTRLAGNTLVVFTSDNGGELNFAANNGALRSGKRNLYEGGIRVPFLARWPGQIRPGTTTELPAQTMDLFATACEVAGAPLPAGIDAVSQVAVLRGATPTVDPAAREFYFVCREGQPRNPASAGGKTFEALIRGDWKILQNSPFAPRELYNLRNDPQEEHDLAKAEPKVFAEMAALLTRHVQRGGGVAWQPPERAP
jgi:arylsulfatase A-like enzyme